ncbi:MAG: flagellar protein FlgN [Lachnospiraceae bacterium]|nr:flagellar protein FlgN [Lachnospiraceae bacterium]
MASLMEELLTVLTEEEATFKQLLDITSRKTQIIVQNDIDKLRAITDEEQNVMNHISHLDKKRETVTHDIADVINKDVETLKLSALAGLLKSQPEERDRLNALIDGLSTTVRQIRRINEQNTELIKHSLEMVEFDLRMVQAMREAPQTANYGRTATNIGGTLGTMPDGFDAKQ